MEVSDQIGYIDTNTVIFARNVIQTIEDMTDVSFGLNKLSFTTSPILSDFGMIIYIHFTGNIQGEYILAMDETTSAKIMGIYEDGMTENEIKRIRDEHGDFVGELLNVSVARSIPELEKYFGSLSYTSATIVYGTIKFPDVLSGNITIKSPAGMILFAFSVNFAKPKIGRKLDRTLMELEKRSIEVNEARKEIENMLHILPFGVVAIDSDGKVLPGHSHATASVIGCRADEIIEGKYLTDFLGLDDIDSITIREWIRIVFSSFDFFPFEKLRSMCENQFSNQHGKMLKLDWLPMINHETNHLEKVQVIIEDITEKYRLDDEKKEKKKLQKQLREAQKMEAIGTLAGGIAHDFNNIIQVIMGCAEISLYTNNPGDKIRKKLTRIIKACHHASDMIKQLLTISRQREQERREMHMEPIVKESIKMLKSTLPKNIEILQSIQPGPMVVLADPTQMSQVVMNLCINAAHAMEANGGILRVDLEKIRFDDNNMPSKHKGIRPGYYVRLIISDTGCGIPVAMIDKIFDPFFTTKSPGKGTGLGLSVVHGIIKNHDGILEVNSQIGKGSTFTIFMPVASRKPIAQTHIVGQAPLGKERILLVDDERNIVETVGEILVDLGYDVTPATNSYDALNTFIATPDSFDLLITDQAMPLMSGIELAESIHNIRSDIPVILCTGLSRQVVMEKIENIKIHEIISKPCSRSKIAQAIRNAIKNNKIENEKQ